MNDKELDQEINELYERWLMDYDAENIHSKDCLIKASESRRYVEVFLSKVAVALGFNEFNQDEKIRPYLDHYPFTSKDLDIRIFFRDHNAYFEPPYVGHCRLNNNEIIYEEVRHAPQYKAIVHTEMFN